MYFACILYKIKNMPQRIRIFLKYILQTFPFSSNWKRNIAQVLQKYVLLSRNKNVKRKLQKHESIEKRTTKKTRVNGKHRKKGKFVVLIPLTDLNDKTGSQDSYQELRRF